MAPRFIPCPACARHVREGDAACPFCGATASPTPKPVRLPGGLSRAAFLALGAASALAGTDCSSASPAPNPGEAGTPTVEAGFLNDASVPSDAEEPDGGGMVQPVYGAMVPDAAGPSEGGFAQPLYGGVAPAYGGPPNTSNGR